MLFLQFYGFYEIKASRRFCYNNSYWNKENYRKSKLHAGFVIIILTGIKKIIENQAQPPVCVHFRPPPHDITAAAKRIEAKTSSINLSLQGKNGHKL